ncbi:hypothetical protein [Rhizobium sp.]
MNRLLTALSIAVVAGSVLADPLPVTNTSKRPYKVDKLYCNDAMLRAPTNGENIACYNHDACYADPQGKSRKDCDQAYLRDMELAGISGFVALVRYNTVRSWGHASWNRSRRKDERQAAGQ